MRDCAHLIHFRPLRYASRSSPFRGNVGSAPKLGTRVHACHINDRDLGVEVWSARGSLIHMRGEGRPGLRVLTTSSLDASTPRHGLSTTRNSAITECGRTTIGLNLRQLGTASLRSRARPIDLLSDVLGPPGFLTNLRAHCSRVRCVSRETYDRGRPRRHMPTSTIVEFTSDWTRPPPGPCSPGPARH
jgi:hypothetical protein